VNLERVHHRIPQALGREDLQHRRLHHVILEAAVDERRGHVRHRFHGVDVRRHARDFLLHQVKLAERLVELLARVRVFNREFQAALCAAGAAGTECRAAEIEHRQRDAQTFAERPEDVLLRHAHIVQLERRRRGALDAELLHPPVDHLEPRHVLRDEERRDRILARLARDWRARHHRQHIRDVDVRDVTLAPFKT
jgi:hypothetical protein